MSFLQELRSIRWWDVAVSAAFFWGFVAIAWRLVDSRFLGTPKVAVPGVASEQSSRALSAGAHFLLFVLCFGAASAMALEQHRRALFDATDAALLGVLFGVVPMSALLALAARSKSSRNALRSALLYVGLVGCSVLLFTLHA